MCEGACVSTTDNAAAIGEACYHDGGTLYLYTLCTECAAEVEYAKETWEGEWDDRPADNVYWLDERGKELLAEAGRHAAAENVRSAKSRTRFEHHTQFHNWFVDAKYHVDD